jgi:2-iminoacetate synthase
MYVKKGIFHLSAQLDIDVVRTGEHFMSIAKKGLVHNYCVPNALFTFKEYLIDYASPETKEAAKGAIENTIKKFDSKKQKMIRERLKLIEDGKRDVYI